MRRRGTGGKSGKASKVRGFFDGDVGLGLARVAKVSKMDCECDVEASRIETWTLCDLDCGDQLGYMGKLILQRAAATKGGG
jgi:hypothetical protein